MLRKVFNIRYHLIFWLVYIGYAIFYQKLAYPNNQVKGSYQVVAYLSFIAFFYGIYTLGKSFLRNDQKINSRIFFYFLGSLLSFYIVREIGLKLTEGYFSFAIAYYLPNIGELFLLGTIALFFSTYEWNQEQNRHHLELLKQRNEKEIELNKSRKAKQKIVKWMRELQQESHRHPISEDMQIFNELVDFLINSSHRATIPIVEEIENLKRYLHLYHLRFGGIEKFRLHIEGDINNLQIPHKSILTLVENCIKYGLPDPTIPIHIRFTPTSVHIHIRNRIKTNHYYANATHLDLQNLCNRLELHLHGSYVFEAGEVEDGWWEVRLEISEK